MECTWKREKRERERERENISLYILSLLKKEYAHVYMYNAGAIAKTYFSILTSPAIINKVTPFQLKGIR